VPSKCKALNSKPSTARNKNLKKKNKIIKHLKEKLGALSTPWKNRYFHHCESSFLKKLEAQVW
jgi:hypothetical protein